MSARNIHHQEVVDALKADGWTITHDPFRLPFADANMYVDLGAEQTTLAAERENQRIAVEIQSFLTKSAVRALQESLGQFELYRAVLARFDPDRVLYMAVSDGIHASLLSGHLGQFVLSTFRIPLIVFDAEQRRILQWID